ncbi:MAG: isoprenylcysteine carboxylmethyltransferase family protein [Anaerolineales bacterium]|nr:isoprenylcysteine carboxylmethyltransferase family protein [Anaerolineales bacterium]
MTIENIFKTIFFILFIGLLCIRLFYGVKVRKTGKSSWKLDQSAVAREGKWSIILRPILFLCMLALVAFYAVADSPSSWLTVPLPEWLRWLGVGLGFFSLALLVWVHHTLREYWSTTLQLRNSHTIITRGPYAWVRHPMYSVLMLCFLGLALVSEIWLLLLWAVLSPVFFNRIAGIEEMMMKEQFGDEYLAYMNQTGRFFPKIFAK